jgi:hypothetical protein
MLIAPPIQISLSDAQAGFAAEQTQLAAVKAALASDPANPSLKAQLAQAVARLQFFGQQISLIQSAPVQVPVIDPILIVSVGLHAGNDASLYATLQCPVPLTYKWQKDGVDIAGSQGSGPGPGGTGVNPSTGVANPQLAAYDIPALANGDTGAYRVVVTNAFGTTTSAAVTLTVS